MNCNLIIMFLIMLHTKETSGGAPRTIPLTIRCPTGKKPSGYLQSDGHSALTCVDENSNCSEPWKSNCRSNRFYLTCTDDSRSCVCTCCLRNAYCRGVTLQN
ncbi:uncharacterized protein LOC142767077 [Rhipicephalus microplus]|uniref:uncharacterized protein LOC142767077 n=1 Tax=Rhipicephalus microplus TaxID=6941 RepID=UPI003F6B867B